MQAFMTETVETQSVLEKYTSKLRPMQRKLLGREHIIDTIMASFARPELCNVILLAPPGAGKTATMQGCMAVDTDRDYLEVDLARMIADITNPDEMAALLELLFDEAAEEAQKGHEIVFFIDEFHQIVQLSAAAVEALKPLLADSGTRGIRVAAATTFSEFREHLASNQPLVERLHRINIPEPDEDTCVAIMKGMAERYEVSGLFHDDNLFHLIYEYTNRYVPSNAQPRKSILMLDQMVGWHRRTGEGMTAELLGRCIYESEGVRVAMDVDATAIKSELDAHVFAQDYATMAVAKRLQLCVANLNDKSRPMATMLLTGSTGSGKAIVNDDKMIMRKAGDPAPTYRCLGELEVGDWVYTPDGREVHVGGIFPQEGDLRVWQVVFEDGQVVRCAKDHLWRVGEVDEDGQLVMHDHDEATESLQAALVQGLKLAVPLAATARFPESDTPASEFYKRGVMLASFGTDMLAAVHIDPIDACIGSSIQRKRMWAGVSAAGDGRIRTEVNIDDEIEGAYVLDVHPTAEDAVLFLARSFGWKAKSLGFKTKSDGTDAVRIAVTGAISDYEGMCCSVEVGVACGEAMAHGELPDEGFNRIVNIIATDEVAPMTCIWLDEPYTSAHLYLTGDFIVTHNTELTKQLARILFHDNDRSLVRFDMSEYANDDSLDRFRRELTDRVWARPYCVVLLDEIEKACASVSRLLLQVFDDGRLTDVNGRVVSFVNTYIVLTTNAGSEIYKDIAQYAADNEGSGRELARYEALIRKSLIATTGANRFPPELLGRIDAIVPFQPLSNETMRRIARAKLQDLKDRVLDIHGVKLFIDKKVLDYLVEDCLTTDSDAGGARAVITKLDSEVTCAVAAFINASPEYKKVGVRIKGEMAFENKDRLQSNAEVEVFAMR